MDFPKNANISVHKTTIVPRYCETDQAGVRLQDQEVRVRAAEGQSPATEVVEADQARVIKVGVADVSTEVGVRVELQVVGNVAAIVRAVVDEVTVRIRSHTPGRSRKYGRRYHHQQ